jgi:single-strand DNA-binding protein
MSNFNQVILMGNLTRDPSLSYTPNQTAVVEFGLAVNRKWKKEDGSIGEEVLFVDCQVFGKRAEVISKHFKKGSPIFVQGRLKLERWEKDGTKQSRIRVIVFNFEFIGKRQDGQPDGPTATDDDIPF